ncbi:hypothetical protein [Pseudoduganella armeniaca]|uniref:hypothetical protein n=1 Tax=Pseudoduganella armeniaca TaxID=2072590 RepID=UPI0015E692A7|nr:hypothetical protein [Pseudoduganella armeniaca]
MRKLNSNELQHVYGGTAPCGHGKSRSHSKSCSRGKSHSRKNCHSKSKTKSHSCGGCP